MQPERLPLKSAESKARKRPNLPCAWHFALYRLDERQAAALHKFDFTSGDASAPPPKNQRDYKQHKEYNEQKFRNARGCCCDTAESKDRCHKRDD